MSAYIAAENTLVTQDGLEIPATWNSCDNAKAILATDDSKIVFADDIDEAIAKIAERHPGPDGMSWYVGSGSRACAMNGVSYKDHEYENVVPVYRGGSISTFAELVKKHKVVHFAGRSLSLDEIGQLNQVGCVNYGRAWVYDPPKAKRSSKPRVHLVTVYNIYNVIYHLRLPISKHFGSGSWLVIDTSTAKSTGDCVAVVHVAKLFNLFFGRHAHRSAEQFQTFVAKWKENQKKNEKKYSECPLFVKWMRRECRAGLPKIKKKWRIIKTAKAEMAD